MAVVVGDVACTNPRCEQRGVTGAGNIVLCWTYGEDVIRFVRCRSCQARFSERRATVLFGLRLSKVKVVEVVKHLAEGIPGRKTARLTSVSRDTAGRITKLVGKYAKEIHDELVQELKIPEVQMDEMWSFVGKKRQKPHRRGARDRRARKQVGPRSGGSRDEADGVPGPGSSARPGDQ